MNWVYLESKGKEEKNVTYIDFLASHFSPRNTPLHFLGELSSLHFQVTCFGCSSLLTPGEAWVGLSYHHIPLRDSFRNRHAVQPCPMRLGPRISFDSFLFFLLTRHEPRRLQPWMLFTVALRPQKGSCLKIDSNPWLMGFPGDASSKQASCQWKSYKRCEFGPWVGKSPWRRAWQPTPVFLPGESFRQRSLAGNSSRGCKSIRHNRSNLVLMHWLRF